MPDIVLLVAAVLFGFLCLMGLASQADTSTAAPERLPWIVILSSLAITIDCAIGFGLTQVHEPLAAWWSPANALVLGTIILDRLCWYLTLWSPVLNPLQGIIYHHRRLARKHQQLKERRDLRERNFDAAVEQMKKQILKGSTAEDLKFLKRPVDLTDQEEVKREALRRIREGV